MRRAVTAVFLSGWVGFLGVSASIPALAVLRIADPGFPVPSMLSEQVESLVHVVLQRGNAELLAAAGVTLFAVVLASILGLALWLIRRTDEQMLGERLAFGGLVGSGVLALAVRWDGSSAIDTAGSLPSFAAILALSVAALRFDRMLDKYREETETDDEAFQAALALIGREMARGVSPDARRDERDGGRGNR